MPKNKESARQSIFFPTNTKTMSEEEFKQYCSAEETGARLVDFISGVCGEAHRRLPDELRKRYELDLKKPDWLDQKYPHIAMGELHRIANQLPRYMPGKVWRPDKKGEQVLTEEFRLPEDQSFAMRILIKIREVVETASIINGPASALLLIEASMNLGHEIAEAVVAPYEPQAAARIKCQQNLDEYNADRSAPLVERSKKLQSKADEIWLKLPDRSARSVAKILEKHPDEELNFESIRKIIKKPT